MDDTKAEILQLRNPQTCQNMKVELQNRKIWSCTNMQLADPWWQSTSRSSWELCPCSTSSSFVWSAVKKCNIGEFSSHRLTWKLNINYWYSLLCILGQQEVTFRLRGQKFWMTKQTNKTPLAFKCYLKFGAIICHCVKHVSYHVDHPEPHKRQWNLSN